MSINKSQPPQEHKALVKSSGLVALGVLSSRILGFARDIVLANVLGTGLIADAFLVAQRLPNLLRDLVGEGAANSAIVPVLTEYQQKHSREEWLKLINVVMAWACIILGAITVIGIVAAPWLIGLVAPGFLADEAKFQLTVDLTRIMFPYLILIALTAIQTGILYSLRSFFTPAFGPCLLNVAMILSAWVAAIFSFPLAYTLSIGVLVGGVWQFWLQWDALRKKDVPWQFSLNLKHPGATQIGKLLVPRIWGSAVYQLNIFADMFCASLASIVGSGGIAAIYFANRLVQFPLGVFGYALASVILPSLSTSAANNNVDEFRHTLLFALRNLLFVMIPSAIILMVESTAIVSTIFEHGAFDSYSTMITVQALIFSALGLPFFGISRILVSACYAWQDTRTPVRVATICLIINVVGNVILMFPLKIGGIALASSISSAANVFLLVSALKGKVGSMRIELKQFFMSLTWPLAAMTAVLIASHYVQGPVMIKTIVVLILAIAAYIGVSILTKVHEVHYILDLMKKKFLKT